MTHLLPGRPELRWVAALPALALLGPAQAQSKRLKPAQPPDWRAGGEARAFASGTARIVRDFVWGQSLEPAQGVLRLRAVDNTWGQDLSTPDQLQEGVARVWVPGEKAEYYVKVTGLTPVGERRPTLGGVLLNHPIFGDTEIAGPGLFPRLKAYVAVWGRADVLKNRTGIARDRPVLAWVGQGARDSHGKWLYHADEKQVTAHLIVFGSLGGGSRLPKTRDGFLHFEWPAAKVSVPGFVYDPATQPEPGRMAGFKDG
jgi:hypothetical protein